MPIIRTRAEIDDLLGGPTPAEKLLLAACEAGEVCDVGDGELPPYGPPAPDRIIRADVLRYLILGGCENCRVQGQGVRVLGAHITGTLDLSYQTACGVTLLADTRFESGINVMQANLAGLNLTGSHILSLNAQGVEVKGDVALNKIISTGEIGLSGAIIGGQLACEGATFSNKGGFALDAEATTIREGLIWRENTACSTGIVNFTAAKIANIVDDLSCWPDDGRLRLNGLAYDRLHGDHDVSARLRWVKSGSYFRDTFTPQPYTQLAKVYRTMGRDGDARRVLRARERLEQKDRQRRWRDVPDGLWKVGFNYLGRQWSEPLLRLWSHFLRATIGYGFAPYRALWWLGGIWLLATLLAHLAWTDGDFAPNSDVLQTSAAWLALADGPNPAETWSTTAPGRDWETFNPYAYAADLVIPIIDLNQTDTWTPSTNRGPWGQRLWRYGFLLNLAGWIITALGVAALTGIVQKERD